MTIAHPELDGLGNYEFGWSDKNDAGANSKRGINEEVVRDISAKKSEPQWMLDLRRRMPMKVFLPLRVDPSRKLLGTS